MELNPTAAMQQQINTLTRQLDETRETLFRVRNELHETRVRMKDLVRLDDATGLPNHRAFVERLGEEVRRTVRFDLPLSILLADIDQYDELEKTHDDVEFEGMLATLVRLIQINTRSVDYIARYNTRQFGLLLPGTPQDGAMLLAERLCLRVEAQQWHIGDVTLSCGVTTLYGGDYHPDDKAQNDEFSLGTEDDRPRIDGKTVIGQAYKAMRHSSLTGRNRVVHALNSAIAPIVPWEEVPTVNIIDAAGEMSLVQLDVKR
ncbi:MAG TPA: GGDEF domain-containing protein [Abditibacteriaceae bacterium]|jgi:diguanylate cyclase (GGDEF)-like protein